MSYFPHTYRSLKEGLFQRQAAALTAVKEALNKAARCGAPRFWDELQGAKHSDTAGIAVEAGFHGACAVPRRRERPARRDHICNAADRPKRGCDAREDLVQRFRFLKLAADLSALFRSGAARSARLLTVVALSGVCVSQTACATAQAQSAEPDKIIVTQQTLDRCLNQLSADADRNGVSAAAFRRYTSKLEPDPGVIDKLNFQPEFVSSVQRYLGNVVNEERVSTGRTMLTAHAPLLAALQAKFGVPGAILVAVWGIESNFGNNFGDRSVVTSLATLACHGRRQPFFRSELFAAVKILTAGHVKPERLVGSWAGAFGHTQFMPSTFLSRAIDNDGDGRRDLIDNIGDALASTANYLHNAGWQSGQPWAIEVNAPPAIEAHSDTRQQRKSVADWRAAGVSAIDPSQAARLSELPPDTSAALIRPAEVGGPTLMAFKNFDAIYAYNPSLKYSLAVGHLADRISGAAGFQTPWPADEEPLTRTERKELQSLLLERGHRVGRVDGILGARSREAIRAEQARRGGTSDQGIRALLQTLRGG